MFIPIWVLVVVVAFLWVLVIYAVERDNELAEMKDALEESGLEYL